MVVKKSAMMDQFIMPVEAGIQQHSENPGSLHVWG
jgi:hypothetical protein